MQLIFLRKHFCYWLIFHHSHPKEIKSIPVEFLQWVRNNYVHGVIPIETLKKATDYLDMSVDDFDVEAPQIEEDFDLDAFLEGDDE